MRLVCPSCSAEYDISTEAIGAKGRMVRCAACASEWFQTPPSKADMAARAEPQVAQNPASIPVPEPAVDSTRGLSALSGFDDEPDVAPAKEYPAGKSESALSRLTSFADEEDEPVQQVYHDVDPEPRKELDPVVEERALRGRHSEELDQLTASLRSAEDEPDMRSGGAFLAGFATVTLVALVLIAVYVKAPELAELAPAVKAPLAAYSDIVDQGRIALESVKSGG